MAQQIHALTRLWRGNMASLLIRERDDLDPLSLIG